MQNDVKKKIKLKIAPFLGANQLTINRFLMLRARLRWQSKSQERLLDFSRFISFFHSQKILLAFISRAAGSMATDTTSRKSAIEEKMFWKVTISKSK